MNKKLLIFFLILISVFVVSKSFRKGPVLRKELGFEGTWNEKQANVATNFSSTTKYHVRVLNEKTRIDSKLTTGTQLTYVYDGEFFRSKAGDIVTSEKKRNRIEGLKFWERHEGEIAPSGPIKYEKLGISEVIAGHSTSKFRQVLPQKENWYRHVWIDDATGIILKEEDRVGENITYRECESISFGAVDPSLFSNP